MSLLSCSVSLRKEEEHDIDIWEILKNVDPSEYEKYARMFKIYDFRGLLHHLIWQRAQLEEGRKKLEVFVCFFKPLFIHEGERNTVPDIISLNTRNAVMRYRSCSSQLSVNGSNSHMASNVKYSSRHPSKSIKISCL